MTMKENLRSWSWHDLKSTFHNFPAGNGKKKTEHKSVVNV